MNTSEIREHSGSKLNKMIKFDQKWSKLRFGEPNIKNSIPNGTDLILDKILKLVKMYFFVENDQF